MSLVKSKSQADAWHLAALPLLTRCRMCGRP
jgi:hypothetical protein